MNLERGGRRDLQYTRPWPWFKWGWGRGNNSEEIPWGDEEMRGMGVDEVGEDSTSISWPGKMRR